ncbi:MAG: transposase [Planctomycetes bacterium]|nr:transposase [Planctomycetota bacterium]
MKNYQTKKIELKRFYLPNRQYFMTCVTENRQPTFNNKKNISLLLNAFNIYRQKYQFKILAYCILPNHLHWLIIPTEQYNISQIMKAIKAYSTKQINKIRGWNGPLWQHQFLDHIIRKEEDYKSHIDYIHKNPFKHNLVSALADLSQYKWSSYQNYYLDNETTFLIDKIPI